MTSDLFHCEPLDVSPNVSDLFQSEPLDDGPKMSDLSQRGPLDVSPLMSDLFQCEPLEEGPDSFRLLRLLPRRGRTIECELIHSSLLEPGSYEALSYSWGSAEKVETIVVNKKTFWIADNLYAALENLVLPDKPRTLWIDGICIDQNNNVEKSQQVQRIGTIFSHADQVLFWLGKATSEVRELFQGLERLAVLLKGQPYALDEARALWSDVQSEPYLRERAEIGLWTLLKRPWFSRVWILQEVAKARKGRVCAGQVSCQADMFALAPHLIEVSHRPKTASWQTVLDLMSRVPEPWTEGPDLYTLLVKTTNSRATDPRDKIFAVLGMSNQIRDHDAVMIDYDRPTHQVYEDVLTYLTSLEHSKQEDMLTIASAAPGIATVMVTVCEDPEFDPDISQIWRVAYPGGYTREAYKNTIAKRDLRFFVRPISAGSQPLPSGLYSEVLELLTAQERTGQQWRVHPYAMPQVIHWGPPESHIKHLFLSKKHARETFTEGAALGFVSIVGLLLDLGFVDLQDMIEHHDNALSLASSRGFEATVTTLLALGFDPNGYPHTEHSTLPIEEAARRDHVRIMEVLIDGGADINATLSCEDTSTPLREAIIKARCDHLEIMFPSSRVKGKGGERTVALHKDCDRQHDIHCLQALRMTLGHADPNLMLASVLHYFDPSLPLTPIIELALEQGANPNHRETNRAKNNVMSMLQLAVLCEDGPSDPTRHLQTLLQHGADVNGINRDHHNSTALHCAIDEGCMLCTKFLLDNGARVEPLAYRAVRESRNRDHETRQLIEALLVEYQQSRIHDGASGRVAGTPSSDPLPTHDRFETKLPLPTKHHHGPGKRRAGIHGKAISWNRFG